jgi:hypothetical protein
MKSAASLLDTASSPVSYVVAVLNLYGELPDTPLRTNPHDQRQARSWFDRGVPLSVVEAALLLASLRRMRPPGSTPLPRIRSLAYFQPVIEELLENPVPEGYVQYLRVKLRNILDKANPADVHNSTFSRDR